MLKSPTLSSEYWQSLDVSRQDVELLQNYLFETETPLTTLELLRVLIEARVREERESQMRRQKGEARSYLPHEVYSAGENVVFPTLAWRQGAVQVIRTGVNPEIGPFQVIEIRFEDGSRRSFAAGLEDHPLNYAGDEAQEEFPDPAEVVAEFSNEMEGKLDAALRADGNLVRIAGRWFPRALLLDISVGQLNLAEAILEVAGGEPTGTPTLMEQIELPAGVNPRLVEFSLNYALQEDDRFDEVGPAGEVLWCLRRAEPEDVQNIPAELQYRPIDHDRSLLTKQMIALDAELDDELSDIEHSGPRSDEATICLTYPHWRAGTLPISARLRGFFPTAYESPRVRFTLIDTRGGQPMPAWVVREHKYVAGLRHWFDAHGLFPGALIRVRPGVGRGEVGIEAATRRPTRDWVRTVLIGSDGGIVFAMLRQQVACDYNERMTAIIADLDAVEQAVAQTARYRQPFEQLVATMIGELSKLTPQGHVHAQELYSAINILRRVPPAPLMATLAGSPSFRHIGDLYFRLAGESGEDS